MASSSSHDDDTEALFRRNYAAQLAQAIQEAEDNNNQLSNEEIVENTYRQLLFDDPRVTAQGCRLLSKALVDPQHQYALSERLVEGIRQVLSRIQHTTTTNSSSEPEQETESPSLLLQPSSDSDSTTAEAAYAALAWVIYGRIPLLCCLADQLVEAAAYLGSYRGPEIQIENDDATNETNNNEQARQEEPIANGLVMNGHGSDHDNEQEVWAAESDPSDYDFGDEEEQQRLDELDLHHHWDVAALNLNEVSQVPNNTSWKGIAQAVTNLIQALSYTSISGLISNQAWNQQKISQHLTQLVLTLLVIPANTSPLLQQYTSIHWQQLGIHVLHVFRDAVLHNSHCLDDYLQLLQTLLQVDAAQESLDHTIIAPATYVGLGALGALCSSSSSPLEKSHTRILKTCILESCDDLTLILEKTSATGDSAATVAWTFISLLDLLIKDDKTTTSLSNTHAQILLNSGLFRQWLIWWEQIEQIETKRVMQESIFRLCCTSPTLLGKYAWRVPNLAASMTSKDTSSLADCVLWNLLGMHLTEQATASKVQWKSKPGTKAAPTFNDCQETAWTGFQRLCQTVVGVLSDWKRRREEGLDAADEVQDQQQTVADFGKIVDALSNSLLLHQFTQRMAPEVDGKPRQSTIQTLVQPIQQLLSQWPSVLSANDAKAKVDDEDVPALESPPQKHHGEEEAVKAMRKSLKVLQSALESSCDEWQSISSKAD